MKVQAHEEFILWCILAAAGGIFMAAGDWLLGCIPIQPTDTGMFNRAYYLSGEYVLWRPVLIVGLGTVGAFLYFFMVPSVDKGKRAHRRPKSPLAVSSFSAGGSPPASSSLPAAIFARRWVLQSFSGADFASDKADEEVGLTPGDEDNAVRRKICPEKPRLTLSADGKGAECGYRRRVQ